MIFMFIRRCLFSLAFEIWKIRPAEITKLKPFVEIAKYKTNKKNDNNLLYTHLIILTTFTRMTSVY